MFRSDEEAFPRIHEDNLVRHILSPRHFVKIHVIHFIILFLFLGERIRTDSNLQHIPEIGKYATIIKPENAESLWPVGVFLPPIDVNDLSHSSQESRHITPDYSNGLGNKTFLNNMKGTINCTFTKPIPLLTYLEYHDPLLLTGTEAMMAVKYIYGRGELFYDDFPHVRAILRNQEERRLNGLHDHILSSLRPSSPFYKRRQH